ncbi:MAG: trypsin-like peptidase domain-containing protein [Oscillospiraceae bacterium]|nr:trypsin-like peptidase domain-containing protein [Oscillospiraceae bacterium]
MKNAKVTVRKLLAILAVVVIFLSATVMSVGAANVSLDKVNEAKQGVFLVVYCYPDPIDPTTYWNAIIGTGFLVNDDTIITCYHVIHPENDTTPEGIAFMEDMIAHDPNYKNKVEIRVYYKAGAYYTATEISNFANSSFDFTAIRLSSPIYGYRTLTLCSDMETSLSSPDPVYALGFPYIDTFYAHNYIDSFTSRDVDTKDGIMSKFYNYEGGEVISHSASTSSGMSGGPLLNGAGQVIGVTATRITGTDSYNYAVKISDIIDSLDITGISYTAEPYKSGNNPTETTTEAPSTEPTEPVSGPVEVDYSALTSAIANAKSKLTSTNPKYKQDGLNALNTAVEEGERVKNNSEATQDEVNTAVSRINSAISNLQEETSKLSLPLIIGIVAVAVIIIAVVIIIVITSSKKKNSDDGSAPEPYTAYPSAGGFAQTAPAPAPSFTPNTFNDGGAETGVLSSSSNETTVLGAGANETTVLNSAPYAKLTRKSNKEIVQITATPFVIGKERRKVNYCIDDNSTISRSHAQIVKNGSKVCVVDLGSKNGTFVNGVKCDPNAAVEVKANDKIVLSDEEFVIELL